MDAAGSDMESEETDGLMSGSAASGSIKGMRIGSGKSVGKKRRTVVGIDKVNYLIFGVLLCMLSAEVLGYMKYKEYSKKITWVLVILPVYLFTGMTFFILHFLYISTIKPSSLKLCLYMFKFVTVKSYLALLTLKAL
jgi:hypothetical protein